MILWLILFIIVSIITYFCVRDFLKEEGWAHLLWIIAIILAITGVISLIASNCAPNQYKPDETIMFSHANCNSIIITPAVNSANTVYTSSFNIEYKLQNNTATLSERIPVYCCSFETSTTGYPYIEKYFCERISSVREFLYGSWNRPRWYYKIYLVPTE